MSSTHKKNSSLHSRDKQVKFPGIPLDRFV